MIGKLLGYTRVQTTVRYAHLARDSMLSAALHITERIGGDLTTKHCSLPARISYHRVVSQDVV